MYLEVTDSKIRVSAATARLFSTLWELWVLFRPSPSPGDLTQLSEPVGVSGLWSFHFLWSTKSLVVLFCVCQPDLRQPWNTSFVQAEPASLGCFHAIVVEAEESLLGWIMDYMDLQSFEITYVRILWGVSVSLIQQLYSRCFGELG